MAGGGAERTHSSADPAQRAQRRESHSRVNTLALCGDGSQGGWIALGCIGSIIGPDCLLPVAAPQQESSPLLGGLSRLGRGWRLRELEIGLEGLALGGLETLDGRIESGCGRDKETEGSQRFGPRELRL